MAERLECWTCNPENPSSSPTLTASWICFTENLSFKSSATLVNSQLCLIYMLNLDLLIYGMALKSPNGELSLEILIFFLHLSDWRTILTKFLEVIIRLQVQFGIYLHE